MARLIAALAGLVLVLAACGEEADPLAAGPLEDDAPEVGATEEVDGEVADEDPAGDAGEGLTAVSSVFPLAWLAREVAPGTEVTFLGAGGADPHDLELSPGDRALLETADVVLYLGDLDFQPQVERAVQDAGGQVVDVRAFAGEDALVRWDRDHDDDHSDEDDHGDDEDGDGHEDDGEYDPHLWFDAAVMADVTVEIGEAFAATDPAHAEAYRGNAERLRNELLVLDAELDALLSGCRFDRAIVSHEGYAYLLAPRGLDQEGISGAGGHAEASPQRIAELAEHISAQGIPAVLAEPLHGREDAEALAREAGVELLEIDPLEIATDRHFERGYPELLREQAERFASALDCRGGA